MKSYQEYKEFDWFLSGCCGKNNFLKKLILKKVSRRRHNKSMKNYPECKELDCFFFQDIVVIHYPPEVMEKNQILATARTSLRSMGIEGLHQTPCFKTLLQNLPNIILEQYQTEKVSDY